MKIVFRRRLRPLFLKDNKPTPYKIVYDVVGTLVLYVSVNFVTPGFALLSLEKTIRTQRVFYFYGYIGVVLVLIYFKFIDPILFKQKPSTKK